MQLAELQLRLVQNSVGKAESFEPATLEIERTRTAGADNVESKIDGRYTNVSRQTGERSSVPSARWEAWCVRHGRRPNHKKMGASRGCRPRTVCCPQTLLAVPVKTERSSNSE